MSCTSIPVVCRDYPLTHFPNDSVPHVPRLPVDGSIIVARCHSCFSTTRPSLFSASSRQSRKPFEPADGCRTWTPFPSSASVTRVLPPPPETNKVSVLLIIRYLQMLFNHVGLECTSLLDIGQIIRLLRSTSTCKKQSKIQSVP